MGNLNISNIQVKAFFENIKVFSSDVCGLGKYFKVKKLIKENKEIYYHFPLGGMLTKTIIYEKLFKLLKKIKKDLKFKKEEEENLGYNNVANHLDIINFTFNYLFFFILYLELLKIKILNKYQNKILMESEETSLINSIFIFIFCY